MMNNNDNTKRVKLDLTKVNGNAFALMGAFQHQARIEKWTYDEIQAVLDDATSDDYDHLVSVLARHTR
jgi:hypothetical protein